MSERICSAEGCSAPMRRNGLCGKHSQRMRIHGSTDLPPRDVRMCDGPACERIAGISGLCRSHYKQHHLGKPLTPLLVATKDLGRPPTCTVPGCGRPHKARGLCKTHNQQALMGRELGEIAERLPPGPCAVEGCERARFANGYCTKHNAGRVSRWRFYGMTPEAGRLLHEEQGRACASCGNPTGLDDMHVDHDHDCCARGSCGRCVRGLLCQSCNLGIGHMKDDPVRLRAAAEYLERQSRMSAQASNPSP